MMQFYVFCTCISIQKNLHTLHSHTIIHFPAFSLFIRWPLLPRLCVFRFEFHAHTVDLVYQNSLLHTREELALVVAGPLTLNAVTFLLVLIRWGCQQIFGSLPSFTSDFIMAQGVWTVLDPGAVLAVDAVLGVSHFKNNLDSCALSKRGVVGEFTFILAK